MELFWLERLYVSHLKENFAAFTCYRMREWSSQHSQSSLDSSKRVTKKNNYDGLNAKACQRSSFDILSPAVKVDGQIIVALLDFCLKYRHSIYLLIKIKKMLWYMLFTVNVAISSKSLHSCVIQELTFSKSLSETHLFFPKQLSETLAAEREAMDLQLTGEAVVSSFLPSVLKALAVFLRWTGLCSWISTPSYQWREMGTCWEECEWSYLAKLTSRGCSLNILPVGNQAALRYAINFSNIYWSLNVLNGVDDLAKEADELNMRRVVGYLNLGLGQSMHRPETGPCYTWKHIKLGVTDDGGRMGWDWNA